MKTRELPWSRFRNLTERSHEKFYSSSTATGLSNVAYLDLNVAE